MDHITIPYTISSRLAALGIEPTEILRRAHLPQTLFHQERIVVTTAQWFALWKATAQLNNDPALGLKVSSMWEGGPYDPLVITALSAPSFHAALGKVAQYKRLFAFEDIRLQAHDREWSVEVVWLATEEPAPALLIDSTFACLVEIGRRGTGQPLYPERVLLRRAPQHRAMYETYFQCPIVFDADCDTAVYSDAAMQQPFLTYNPDLLALLEPQLAAALRDRVPQQGCIDQVKTLLRSRLAGTLPTMRDIAHELNISARTLQRRLADEGVQFQHLVEAVRRDLAKQYLCESSLALNEIAFLLGYQEASSFHRAFHHWEGISPGRWRAAQR